MTTVLIVVGVFFLLSLVVGVLLGRSERVSPEEYFLAGRSLPWYALALSMAGSNLGATCWMGVAGVIGLAWAFGLAPLTTQLGSVLAYTILVWVFLPFFFRRNLATTAEYLEHRYNEKTRTFFAMFTLAFMIVGLMIPALFIGGAMLHSMAFGQPLGGGFSWGLVACIGVVGLVTGIYVVFGGLRSVVWAGVLQAVVLIIGALLMVIIGAGDVGGLGKVIDDNTGAVVRQLPDGELEKSMLRPDANAAAAESEGFYRRTSVILPMGHPISPWTALATGWLTLTLWMVGTNQSHVQRFLGARSEWDARMGVLSGAILKLIVVGLVVMVGLIAFVKFGFHTPDVSREDVGVRLIGSVFAVDGTAGGFALIGQGVLLCALLAAVMSTVASALNSSATIWLFDIHQRMVNSSASDPQLVGLGRIITVVILLLATAAAPLLVFTGAGFLLWVYQIAAVLATPIVVIFLVGFLWQRAHGRAATFTLVVGVIAGAILWLASSLPWIASGAIDMDDPIVAKRLATSRDPELSKLKRTDAKIIARRQELLAEAEKDPAVLAGILQDEAIRARLFEKGPLQDRLAASVAEAAAKDKEFRERLAKRDSLFRSEFGIDASMDPKVVAGMLRDLGRDIDQLKATIKKSKPLCAELSGDPAVRPLLVKDAMVTELMLKDGDFRKQLVLASNVEARLLDDPTVREVLIASPVVQELLARDQAVQRQRAKARVDSWFSFVPADYRGYVFEGFQLCRSTESRAAIIWVFCMMVMFLATLRLQPDPYERFDPEAIWSPSFGRLPVDEREAVGGIGNLGLWWLVLVAVTGALIWFLR